MAARGRLEEAPNGDRFVVLEDGRRYEGKPGAADYRVLEFERLGRRIEPAELRALPISTKAIPTPTLAISTAGSSAPSCSGACRCRSPR